MRLLPENKKTRISLIVISTAVIFALGVITYNLIANRLNFYAEPGVSPPTIPPAAISGNITTPDGSPLPGAQINLCRYWGYPYELFDIGVGTNGYGSCTAAYPTITADPDGYWEIAKPLATNPLGAAGSYKLTISYTSGSQYYSKTHELYYTPGQTITYDTTLNNAAIPLASLKIFNFGNGYTGDGPNADDNADWSRPHTSPPILSGANCNLTNGSYSTTKISDADGMIKIYPSDINSNFPYGSYTATCTKTNYLAKTTPIINIAANTSTNYIMAMKDVYPSVGNLSVNLTNPDGSPLNPSTIWLRLTYTPTGQMHESGWGGSPTISLAHLPPGNYVAMIYGNGYVTYNGTFTITGGQTTTITAALAKSGSIKGSIYGIPYDNSDPWSLWVTAQLLDSTGTTVLDNQLNVIDRQHPDLYNPRLNVTTKLYAFYKDLPLGNYKIRVSGPRVLTKTFNVTILDLTQQIIDLTFNPADLGCMITGTVNDGPQGLNWAAVSIQKNDDSTITDRFVTGTVPPFSDGQYELSRNLPVGNYTMKVSALGYDTQTKPVTCTGTTGTVNNFSMIKTSSALPNVITITPTTLVPTQTPTASHSSSTTSNPNGSTRSNSTGSTSGTSSQSGATLPSTITKTPTPTPTSTNPSKHSVWNYGNLSLFGKLLLLFFLLIFFFIILLIFRRRRKKETSESPTSTD